MIPKHPEARRFIDEHVSRIRPLLLEWNRISWEAATTGSEDAVRRSAEARAAVKRAYSGAEDLARVRTLLAEDGLDDPLVRRQLVLLEHGFTANQLPAEMLEELAFREAELEQIFYNYRASFEGRELSNNELKQLLRTETDSARRRRVWEASKGIGPEIAPKLLALVRRRNEAARELGFDNYYSMELELQEFDEEELFGLLEDFHTRSEESFRELIDRVDGELSDRFGVGVDSLRPWHWYDFFGQDPPPFGGMNLDGLFQDVDQEALAREYFHEIGLPVDDILQRSDLYEREGKDQHAFCTDIDREGDVRILCNLRRDERWTQTLLHELGHAVYDKFIPRELPFLVRVPAHTLSTESIAMFFGRLTREADWLRSTIGARLSPDEQSGMQEQQKLSMLISTRWMLVMVHFERALYRDPGRADLNRLWWDLVERYQFIRRPDDRDAPDWATKIHLSLAPVYYHNYLLGELMASQLTQAMREAAADGTGVGTFLRERVFTHGARYPWNELLKVSTGEPLSARFFVEQFVSQPLAGGA